MGRLSRVLRNATDGGLIFMCPGCMMRHQIKTGPGEGPRWTWDGNVDSPAFHPSIHIKSVRHDMNAEEWKEYEADYAQYGREVLEGKYGTVCHSFVTAGNIQFLGDCTHHLANQTVPLPSV